MVRSRVLVRLVISSSVIIVALLAAALPGQPVAAGPLRQGAIDFEWRLLSPPPPIIVVPGAETVTVISGFTLRNNATNQVNYRLEVTSLPNGWDADLSSTSITLPGTNAGGGTSNTQAGITLRLVIPPGAPLGNTSVTVTAFKLDANNQPVARSDLFVPIQLILGAPLPTPEPPPGCPEVNDPGNSFDGATLVRVDLEQAHGICEVGDEDWFRFAAVGGKVYTIDISQMDLGLDLVLELYDDTRALLTSNDDFYNRDPAAPDPFDKRPRIQSWRAPRDGIYFVRVRDTLGIGGRDLGYRFVVRGESFGPTPTTVPEVCNDPFEPNGLPEIARLIFSNETQRGHLLCPTGDADWVRFFAIAGRLYIIYTDTRAYAVDANNPEPGADTTLLLADRDGSRILDFNNDTPGGNTLDSEIQFRPVVDGFYYAQVKNVGDIGSQFIRYDLAVRACPGEYCRPDRPGAPPAPPPVPTFELPPAP